MKFFIALCIAFLAVSNGKDDIETTTSKSTSTTTTTTSSSPSSSEEIEESAGDATQRPKSYLQQCLDDNNLRVEDVRPINMGDFSNPTKSIQCFATCMIGKYGFIVDGVVKEDVIRKLLTPLVGEEKLNQIIKKCETIKGEDRCETAFKKYECFYTLHAESKAQQSEQMGQSQGDKKV